MAENQQYLEIQIEMLQEELVQTKRQLAVTLERSVELAQKAVEAESAKRRFMARISADIRVPLNIILDASQLLIQEELMYPQRQQVDTIRHSAEQLLELFVTSIVDCIEFEEESSLTPVSTCYPLNGLNSHDAVYS